MGEDEGFLAPLLVTLAPDPATFDRLDALRRRFFPPGRNIVPAHVSLFHLLPREEERLVRNALGDAVIGRGPIGLRFPSLKRLGRGMAATVDAPELRILHARLSRDFEPWLTAQDRQPFRPHVTLMNKAEPAAAALAFSELAASWEPWEGTGEGLLLWEYLGGPWRLLERYPFVADSGTTSP